MTTSNSPIAWRNRLGIRMGLTLAMTGIAGFGLIMLFISVSISSRFSQMEDEEIERNIGRAQELLLSLRENTQNKSLDWGVWTDSYEFIADRNQTYIDENLQIDSFLNLNVNAVSFVTFDGEVRFSNYFDLDALDVEPVLDEAFARFAAEEETIRKIRNSDLVSGFVQFSNTTLIVAAAQIKLSDGTGEPIGFLVFGTELSEQALTEDLQFPVNIDSNPSESPARSIKTDRHIEYTIGLPGFGGGFSGSLGFQADRSLMAAGTSLMSLIAIGTASLLAVMVFVINRSLGRLVVRPLSLIESHVSQTANRADLEPLDYNGRADELGSLVSGFNRMTVQRNRLRANLEQSSFELGKTQESIDIMHNVRNMISPVGVMLSKISELSRSMTNENAVRAINELAQEDLDAGRRKKLGGFLQLAHDTDAERASQIDRLAQETQQSINQAVAAIEVTQNENGRKPETQASSLKDLVKSSLSLARIEDRSSIQLDMTGLQDAQVETNHILFNQVMGNILANAMESLETTGRPDGVIRISSTSSGQDETKAMRLLISDNGEGFDPNLQKRLFERGYSTRTERTGGNGLHWSGNTMRTLGGSIRLASEGKGQGAMAEILLPIATEDQSSNAEVSDRQERLPEAG